MILPSLESAAYPLFPEFGVIAKLPWSNNVYDERDTPPQVLFGAMDPRYDVLSNLRLLLEYHYKLNPGSLGIKALMIQRIKERTSKLLSDSIEGEWFSFDRPGLLGSHSVRKLAATHCRSCGCSKVRCCMCYIFIYHMLFNPCYYFVSG